MVALMVVWVSARRDASAETSTHAFKAWAHRWLSRCYKPLATVFLFLLLSQILLKAGFLAGLKTLLAGLPTIMLAPVAATLAILSGYITGSNVGGNAIFMPTLAGLPLAEQTTTWLAAIQNSAAGHGAMGSMAILALIFGLANASTHEQHSLIRYGAMIVALNGVLIAVLGGVLLIAT